MSEPEMDELYPVRICGQMVQITEDDPGDWQEEGMGRCRLSKGRISLCPDMPEDIKMATMLHEIIHMMADMNSLSFLKDETGTSVLANSLLAFMKDNPDLIKRIIKEKV